LQGWDGDVICGQAVAHCVGAEAGTVGDIGDFVFRPWLRFEIKKRPTCVLCCPMDCARQIFLIIHETHPCELIRCAERHAGTFQSSFVKKLWPELYP
jgi:hypothetical protein